MPPEPAQKAAALKDLTAVDPATAASVHGTIRFEGKPPAPIEIDMAQDPACSIASKQANFSQQFIVNHGGLANVYVYVEQGLEGKNFAVPTEPVVLDQKGCRYVPHMVALVVGQTLRVMNSDPTMHNVHAQPSASANPQWNMSQMPRGQPIDTRFQTPELMMPFKCNQHPWMKAYVNVAANPFFAISDLSGSFEIRGLPPGEYTLAVIHEALGEQRQKIVVGAKESRAADFTYKLP
jgi:plastocyanin